MEVNWESFSKFRINVGTVIEATFFKEAKKPALKLKIDFGEIGILQSSAQITDLYDEQSIVGKQIVAVTNLPPKRIAGFKSECLVLGAITESGNVILLSTDRRVKNGSPIA